MISFKEFLLERKQIQLNEGGNASIVHADGSVTSAEKIDMIKTGRKEFMNKFVAAFEKMNDMFEKKYKYKIWVDPSKLITGELFNGSTSYIFDASIPDDELLKYKNSSGDLDLIVPKAYEDDIFEFLQSLEGKELVDDITFTGITNPKTWGETIICIFTAVFGDYKVQAQVDFELLPVDNTTGTPNEWAKFSHSSSFEDAKIGAKGVAHKYLIQAIMGAASVRDDIVIITAKSTIEKPRLKKMTTLPRMTKFSVVRGVRYAYEPVNNPDGTPFMIDGKMAYREKPSKTDDYITIVGEIYKLCFNRLEDNKEDEKLFWSFKGITELMNKYLSKEEVDTTVKRLLTMMWGIKGPHGQELEEGNPELDFQVKNGIYSHLVKNLKKYDHTKKVDDQIKYYYDVEWKSGKRK